MHLLDLKLNYHMKHGKTNISKHSQYEKLHEEGDIDLD